MNAEIILIYTALVSIMATFIALVTSLVKKAFGSRLSPVFHYYIWFLFVLRLVFPVMPESSFSIYTIASGIYQNLNSASHMDSANGGADNNPEAAQIKDGDNNVTDAAVLTNIQNENAAADNSEKSNLPVIINILFIFYLAVAISGLSVYIFSYVKYKRRIIKTFAPASDEEIRLLENIKSSLNIRKGIRLYKGAESLLIGVFSPVIVLSDNCGEYDKSAVIAHELTHCKNKDNFINVILSVIKCVYWFNPFIHYFIRRIKDDMELLCDIKSINKLNYRKDEYAMMLFNSSKNNKKEKVMPGALGMSSSGKQLLYRLRFISNFKKSGKIASIIATVIVIVLLVTTCSNPIGTSNLNGITISDYAGNLINSFQNTPYLSDTCRLSLTQITSADDLVNRINADNPNIKLSGTAKLTREQLAYMTNFFLDFAGINKVSTDNKLTVLPMFVEKSVFESKIEPMQDKDLRTYQKIMAYFTLKDPSDSTLEERARQEMIVAYPICKTLPVYVFDPNSSSREQQSILGYLQQYTDLTDADIIKMNIQYKLFNNLTQDNSADISPIHGTSTNLLEIYDANNGGVYSDFNKVSDYAKDSVNKLYSLGVFSGASDNKFSPAGTVTSQESAKTIDNIIYSLLIY